MPRVSRLQDAAARCRWLASEIDDPRARTGLLYLAGEYDGRAERIMQALEHSPARFRQGVSWSERGKFT
jgi:hypothetical protein